MRVTGLAIAGVLLAAACGTPGPSITADEAREQGDEAIQETLHGVQTDLEFIREDSSEYDSESGSGCTRGLDEFTGQVQVSVRYLADQTWDRDAAMPAQVEDFLQGLREYWNDHGVSFSDNGHYLNAHIDGDRVYAKYISGKLRVAAVSGCVWPDGTPDPIALGGG